MKNKVKNTDILTYITISALVLTALSIPVYAQPSELDGYTKSNYTLSNSINDIDYNEETKRFAIGTSTNVELWEKSPLQGEKWRNYANISTGATAKVDIRPDGEHVAVVSDGAVVYDMDNQSTLFDGSSDTGSARDVKYSDDGTYLIYTHTQDIAQQLNATNGYSSIKYLTDRLVTKEEIAILENANKVVFGEEGNNQQAVYNLTSGNTLYTIDFTGISESTYLLEEDEDSKDEYMALGNDNSNVYYGTNPTGTYNTNNSNIGSFSGNANDLDSYGVQNFFFGTSSGDLYKYGSGFATNPSQKWTYNPSNESITSVAITETVRAWTTNSNTFTVYEDESQGNLVVLEGIGDREIYYQQNTSQQLSTYLESDGSINLDDKFENVNDSTLSLSFEDKQGNSQTVNVGDDAYEDDVFRVQFVEDIVVNGENEYYIYIEAFEKSYPKKEFTLTFEDEAGTQHTFTFDVEITNPPTTVNNLQRSVFQDYPLNYTLETQNPVLKNFNYTITTSSSPITVDDSGRVTGSISSTGTQTYQLEVEDKYATTTHTLDYNVQSKDLFKDLELLYHFEDEDIAYDKAGSNNGALLGETIYATSGGGANKTGIGGVTTSGEEAIPIQGISLLPYNEIAIDTDKRLVYVSNNDGDIEMYGLGLGSLGSIDVEGSTGSSTIEKLNMNGGELYAIGTGTGIIRIDTQNRQVAWETSQSFQSLQALPSGDVIGGDTNGVIKRYNTGSIEQDSVDVSSSLSSNTFRDFTYSSGDVIGVTYGGDVVTADASNLSDYTVQNFDYNLWSVHSEDGKVFVGGDNGTLAEISGSNVVWEEQVSPNNAVNSIDASNESRKVFAGSEDTNIYRYGFDGGFEWVYEDLQYGSVNDVLYSGLTAERVSDSLINRYSFRDLEVTSDNPVLKNSEDDFFVYSLIKVNDSNFDSSSLFFQGQIDLTVSQSGYELKELGQTVFSTNSSVVDVGEWQHVGLRYDSTDNVYDLLVDGELVGNATQPYPSQQNLEVRIDTGSNNDVQYDTLRVWNNQTLSDPEYRAMINSDRGVGVALIRDLQYSFSLDSTSNNVMCEYNRFMDFYDESKLDNDFREDIAYQFYVNNQTINQASDNNTLSNSFYSQDDTVRCETTVSDRTGNTFNTYETATLKVGDEGTPNITRFEQSPASPSVNEEITFEATCTDEIGVDEARLEVTDPNSVTDSFVMTSDGRNDYIRSLIFSLAGEYDVELVCEDGNGNTDTASTTFDVSSQNPGSGGGGGGGSTEIIVDDTDIDISVEPKSLNVDVSNGSSASEEIRLENVGDDSVEVDIRGEGDIEEWIRFDDSMTVEGLPLEESDSFGSGVLFVSFDIVPPEDVNLGSYEGEVVFDVRDSEEVERVNVSVEVVEGFSFGVLGEDVFNLQNTLCNFPSGYSTVDSCKVETSPIPIKVWHILLAIVVLVTVAYSVMRRD